MPTVAEFANGSGCNTGGLRGLNDLIDEDGVFGDIETGPRLLKSPIEGFH